MQTLFDLEPVAPEGFSYYPNFISGDEEASLLEAIHKIELHTFLFQGYEGKRRVASFGYDWSFEKRMLKKGKEIPEAFHPLVEKVAAQLGLQQIAELLITEYPPGAVINWHRDAPPFDAIAGISLLADCQFRFRPHDVLKRTRKTTLTVAVERRSLYLMKGAARAEWEHSIAPVTHARYSITLRTLRADSLLRP